MISSNERIILSLDVFSLKEAVKLIDELGEYINIFKVGLQLFTKVGPRIIKEIHQRKKKVFLDLKFFDIPSIVAKSAEIITELNIFMFNIHLLGGLEMIKMTKEVVIKKSEELNITPPLILGVTLLTSFNQKNVKNICGGYNNIASKVTQLAKLAKRERLDGVVASAKESKLIRKYCGEDFIIVTPGIRFSGTNSNDQKRIATPSYAILSGSDYLVIGRPILLSSHKKQVIKNILQELKNC